MLTYQAFVDELRTLITSGQSLCNLPSRRDEPEFRRWKHEVVDLIERIQVKGSSLNSL